MLDTTYIPKIDSISYIIDGQVRVGIHACQCLRRRLDRSVGCDEALDSMYSLRTIHKQKDVS